MKSYVGILLIELFNKKQPDKNVNIIVPSLKLKEDWENHIKKHSLTNCHVWVINSYTKSLIKYQCGFLVIDECHHVLGAEAKYFNKTIDITNFDYCFCMTATLSVDERSNLYKRGFELVDELGLEEKYLVFISELAYLSGFIALHNEEEFIPTAAFDLWRNK